MGWEVIDCQPMESTPKASLNRFEYECQIEYDSEEYCLNLGVSREVLDARKKWKKEEACKKFCREVVEKAITSSHFDKIKGRWTQNSKTCFAFVDTHRNERDWVRISYGPTWDMKVQDVWLPEEVIRF